MQDRPLKVRNAQDLLTQEASEATIIGLKYDFDSFDELEKISDLIANHQNVRKLIAPNDPRYTSKDFAANFIIKIIRGNSRIKTLTISPHTLLSEGVIAAIDSIHINTLIIDNGQICFHFESKFFNFINNTKSLRMLHMSSCLFINKNELDLFCEAVALNKSLIYVHFSQYTLDLDLALVPYSINYKVSNSLVNSQTLLFPITQLTKPVTDAFHQRKCAVINMTAKWASYVLKPDENAITPFWFFKHSAQIEFLIANCNNSLFKIMQHYPTPLQNYSLPLLDEDTVTSQEKWSYVLNNHGATIRNILMNLFTKHFYFSCVENSNLILSGDISGSISRYLTIKEAVTCLSLTKASRADLFEPYPDNSSERKLLEAKTYNVEPLPILPKKYNGAEIMMLSSIISAAWKCFVSDGSELKIFLLSALIHYTFNNLSNLGDIDETGRTDKFFQSAATMSCLYIAYTCATQQTSPMDFKISASICLASIVYESYRRLHSVCIAALV